jgi:drug/metabolite transporter (DMT)-like permease
MNQQVSKSIFSQSKHSVTRNLTILTIGVLAASTSSIFIRYAQEEANSLIIAAYRLGIATTILLPIALLRYRSTLLSFNRRQWLSLSLAGLFLGAHFGTWISSLAFTTVASSVVIVQTTPLFVMILSPLLLQERPKRYAYLGLFVALLGGIVIAISESCSLPLDRVCLENLTQQSSRALTGDALALAGAISGALYMILGRSNRGTIDLIPYITVVYGIAAISLFLIVGFLRLPITGYSPSTYLWFLLLALLPQLLAHSSYNWVLRYLPASSVSLSLLGEPVAAAILAYLLLGEVLPGLRIIGALLILSGIAIAIIQTRKPSQARLEIDTMQG